VRCAARASRASICAANSGGTGCDASAAACPAGRQRLLPELHHPGQQNQTQSVALGQLRSLYLSIKHDQGCNSMAFKRIRSLQLRLRSEIDPTAMLAIAGLAPLLEMLLHTADKSFQGTAEGFDHAVNSKSVSGLARMIPDFQALGIAIC